MAQESRGDGETEAARPNCADDGGRVSDAGDSGRAGYQCADTEPMAVYRIWREHRLKPHQAKGSKVSNQIQMWVIYYLLRNDVMVIFWPWVILGLIGLAVAGTSSGKKEGSGYERDDAEDYTGPTPEDELEMYSGEDD